MDPLADNFRYCSDCKKIISSSAQTCPYCACKMPDGGIQMFTVGGLFLIICGSWLFFEPTELWGIVCNIAGIFLLFAAWTLYKAGKVTEKDFKEKQKQEYHPPEETPVQPSPAIKDPQAFNEPTVSQYWETSDFVKIKASLNIDYIDAKGQESNRTIFIQKYDGSCYLSAFCDDRQDHRTFRIDRIQNAIDAETGEIIKSVSDYLLNKYKSTPEYKLDKTFEKAADIIKILYYVGKSDSQLRKEELSIISDLVRKIAKDETISDETIKKRLNKIPVPSPQAYKLAVDRVYKKSPKNLEVTKAIAKKIIATQKTVHKNEQDALDFIDKKLKKPNKAAKELPTT